MPNPNAVVSASVRVDRAREGGDISVELDGGRVARLDPEDPKSTGLSQILEGLGELRRPVYLEIDPATEQITRLLVPLVGHVVSIGPTREGRLDVELDTSHARHVVELGTPDASDIEGALRDAARGGRPILLTEDDAHTVIDVRALPAGMKGVPLPPFPRPELKPPRLFPWPLSWVWLFFHWLWWWLLYPWFWWGCQSTSQAQEIFNQMAATTCAPLAPSAPCIPFAFPDDGCWARAHEMCRLMINMGLSPRKVWIDASAGHYLHALTRNKPNCYVDWGWHVAPTLCVRAGFFWTKRMVIDPSLFTTPVDEPTWKGVQGDPGATLTQSDSSLFWHNGTPGDDPAYVQSNYYLQIYRLELQNRSISVGPPPYATCP